MKKILFVCLGNICRSPMAEFVMKDLVRREGKAQDYLISSAATSHWEVGNPIYPPAEAVLRRRGIPMEPRQARQLEEKDYDRWHRIIAMDQRNLQDLTELFGGDPDHKIHLLMEYTGKAQEIADPYFTGDFETAFSQIRQGCQSLLEVLNRLE